MNIFRLDPRTKPVRSGLSIYKKGRLDAAVLCIQGYNGYVQDLSYFADCFHSMGFTVSVPRSPGCATSALDFRASGHRYWLRSALDAYLELRAEHEHVFLTGLSMGGLISLILASHFPVDGLILAAPALKLRAKAIAFTPLLKHFIKKMPSGEPIDEPTGDRTILRNEYWNWHHLDMLAELRAVQKLAYKRLAQVTSDMLMLVSHADETVPPEVAPIIRKRTNASNYDIVELQHSSHVITDGEEKELAADYAMRWLARKSLKLGLKVVKGN